MLYDYERNIKITKNKNGEIVVKMNDAILTKLICCVFDAEDQARQEGYEATADDNRTLFFALYNKQKQLGE